jgi:hypothetical protein
LTNTEGNILGLKIFDGHIYYAADTERGRAPLGNAAGKDDTYATIEDDDEYHPMELLAGTLKFGPGRYVGSVAEWLYELKVDGYRAIAFKTDGEVHLAVLAERRSLGLRGHRDDRGGDNLGNRLTL